MNFKPKMTPQELSELTGYTPQTLNRWVRKFGWKTSTLPGVKGGRAHVIHVDDDVREYLMNTPLMRNAQQAQLAEPESHYAVKGDSLEYLWLASLRQLTESEREQLHTLLYREGIGGIIRRLGLQEDRQ
ncbi:putative DNA-binding transcriptional regulator [Enterobacterales bacterium BIT-L3]|uniref:DNA-binding transcriptional regulator n=3 Tax=Enterobacteriaceae TaxID=543 RepID=A0A949Q135_9ENTR|nr:putative DNA-binding transcriptional regulator [Tenebrionibacter intestinalis]MBV5094929.1 putative DNA-binding transcriptional regulator [Tenebrionicola larvae]